MLFENFSKHLGPVLICLVKVKRRSGDKVNRLFDQRPKIAPDTMGLEQRVNIKTSCQYHCADTKDQTMPVKRISNTGCCVCVFATPGKEFPPSRSRPTPGYSEWGSYQS